MKSVWYIPVRLAQGSEILGVEARRKRERDMFARKGILMVGEIAEMYEQLCN